MTTDNPVAYALMGLTGLFEGTFKRLPYYYKVREYNDVESRDLWEYELAFTPEAAVHADGAHLGSGAHALRLLLPRRELLVRHPRAHRRGAARGSTCSRSVTSPIIPAATVQALFQSEGLVRSVRHRPSLHTQLAARVVDLSRQERDWVAALEKNPHTPLPADMDPAATVRVLDAALDLVDIRHARELVKDREHGDGARIKQALLERRAAIRVPSPELMVPSPIDKAPERGHGARRIGLSLGRSTGNDLFVGTDFRLALHDLADASHGYPDLAQIEFLPVRMRFGESDGRFRVELHEADLVRVRSLSSLERFDKHISFQIAAGARAINDRGCRHCYAGQAHHRRRSGQGVRARRLCPVGARR